MTSFLEYMSPQNPKSGREQEFQAKTRKCTKCTISETAHPFKPKFEDIAANFEIVSVVVRCETKLVQRVTSRAEGGYR